MTAIEARCVYSMQMQEPMRRIGKRPSRTLLNCHCCCISLTHPCNDELCAHQAGPCLGEHLQEGTQQCVTRYQFLCSARESSKQHGATYAAHLC